MDWRSFGEGACEDSGLSAVILAGGYGTRLRPLTLTVPKPVIQFMNEPFIVHQIRALQSVGVKNTILATSLDITAIKREMKPYIGSLTCKLHYIEEPMPLGTAGPMHAVLALLESLEPAPSNPASAQPSPVFVLNCDVICNYPLREMLDFHQRHRRLASIALTQAADPSRYGVVTCAGDGLGRVTGFYEKPKTWVGNEINSGIYLLGRAVLQRIQPNTRCFFENDVFPDLIQSGELYALTMPGFWMDIGKPGDYLLGLRAAMAEDERANNSQGDPSPVPSCPNLIHPVLIAKNAHIAPDATIGPYATIGSDAVVKSGARIKNSAIFSNAVIGAHTYIDESIVGWKSVVGDWARLSHSVLGLDVQVGDEVCLRHVKALPHKVILEDINEETIVM